jgi:hypothetical protein
MRPQMIADGFELTNVLEGVDDGSSGSTLERAKELVMHLLKSFTVGLMATGEVLQNWAGSVEKLLLDELWQFWMMSKTLHHLVENWKTRRVVCV